MIRNNSIVLYPVQSLYSIVRKIIVTPENIQGRDRLTMSQQSRTQFPSQQVTS
jgi:hypothetical protein